MARKRKLTETVREAICRRVLDGKTSRAEEGRRYKVRAKTVGQWVKEYKARQEAASLAPAAKDAAPEAAPAPKITAAAAAPDPEPEPATPPASLDEVLREAGIEREEEEAPAVETEGVEEPDADDGDGDGDGDAPGEAAEYVPPRDDVESGREMLAHIRSRAVELIAQFRYGMKPSDPALDEAKRPTGLWARVLESNRKGRQVAGKVGEWSGGWIGFFVGLFDEVSDASRATARAAQSAGYSARQEKEPVREESEPAPEGARGFEWPEELKGRGE